MEPPRHGFAGPPTSGGDFAPAPASPQASVSPLVQSDPVIPSPCPRPDLAHSYLPPMMGKQPLGLPRGCTDLHEHTRAHAEARTQAYACARRPMLPQARTFTQADTHSHPASTPTLTLSPSPCVPALPSRHSPLPRALTPAHTHVPSHTPYIYWALTVGAGGAGSGREKTRDSAGEEGCGGCAGEGNDSPRSPSSPGS